VNNKLITDSERGEHSESMNELITHKSEKEEEEASTKMRE
jgi:hypothetical protein